MNYTEKSREELIGELQHLQKKVTLLENSETLLKLAQKALQEEAVRRKILVEQSTDGIVVLTADGKVYEANQKYADMLGYSFEEAQQLSIWDWERSFSREAVVDMLQTVNEKGDHFETRHTRKDGSEYDVEISTNGTMCGDQKLIFCVCRDITDRKRGEERLKENEELLATFIDNFQGIAFQVACDDLHSFTLRLFRGAVEPITGYTPAELELGRRWDAIVNPDDLTALKVARNRLLTIPGFLSEVHYRISHKDGSLRWVSEIARVVTIGRSQLIHGTVFDITTQKLAEEANLQLEDQIRHTQKLEAIGTLAGGVAHDFNNNLSIIMGYTDMALADIAPDSRPYEKLRHVKKASLRAREIVRQLLTFSRKVGPKKQPLNLSSIITETASFMHSTLPSSTMLICDVPPEKMTVLADPTQMHQVILNLCVNASQALESHNGTITLSICRQLREALPPTLTLDNTIDSYIAVTVHDTGCGIKPEIIERIFEPYFTTRDTGKGTGMGLAVVHGIIENHGGDIAVSSNPHDGTTFVFALPEYTRKITDVPASEDSEITGSESVLFIDDEEEITTIAHMMLESQGFRVTTATDSIKALALFKDNPQAFDIVITDLAMPDMSGDQLFKEMRAIRDNLPVIICTGHSSTIDEQKARQMGIAAYIYKPLSKTELTRIVRDVLDGKSDTRGV